MLKKIIGISLLIIAAKTNFAQIKTEVIKGETLKTNLKKEVLISETITQEKIKAENVQHVKVSNNQPVVENTLPQQKKSGNGNDTIITKDATDLTLKFMVVKSPTGVLLAQGKLVNNKKDGMWRTYYDNGTLQRIDEYKAGKRNGATINFDRSSYLMSENTYKNDELDGISTTYINGGKIKNQIEYKKGKLDGLKILNYEDGTHQEESYWKNGIKNGITKWFYQL